MIYVAAYDIEDDATRLKVAKTLEAWGFSRVQRSLYIGSLPRGRVQDLAKTLARVLEGRGHLLIIPVAKSQLEARIEVGTAPYNPPAPPKWRQALLI